MASPVGHPSRALEKKKVRIDVVDAPPLPPASSTRDWSELPLDALTSIFGKLGAIEILMGAGLVCRSWLAAAKLPDLWRSVDMACHKIVDEIETNEARPFWLVEEPKINEDALCTMARVAVDRSGGQMVEFVGKMFVTDELLKYIGDRSAALNTLGLISCYAVTNQGFTHLVAKCPMLENLKLLRCNNVAGRDVYEATGMACARLKHFTLYHKAWYVYPDERGEVLGVAAMHELRSLTLSHCVVTNDELVAVLDGCPRLELLDLRGCLGLDVVVDDAVMARCAGIKSLKLPCDSARVVLEDFEYEEKLSSRDCDGDYWDSD